MSTESDYTSGSYSDRLQIQLDLNMVSQLSDGREEYRISDKVGNMYNDSGRKLRKYLCGGSTW